MRTNTCARKHTFSVKFTHEGHYQEQETNRPRHSDFEIDLQVAQTDKRSVLDNDHGCEGGGGAELMPRSSTILKWQEGDSDETEDDSIGLQS